MKNDKSFVNIVIPVSLGELIDKITILEIKKEHIQENKKLKNINKELGSLKKILLDANLHIDSKLINQLKKVNNILWNIEDEIRIKENDKEFDNEFIKLARSVYKENDKRALIKEEINYTYNSELIEEKYYSNN
tara:strand:+ start:956 stop:1357 length:402 start_codon:yes stop_codon:yes gene_type:complete